MSNLTKAESARINGAKSLDQPTNKIELDLIPNMVAARWRRIWRFETAMLDIKMNSQSPDSEKLFQKPLRAGRIATSVEVSQVADVSQVMVDVSVDMGTLLCLRSDQPRALQTDTTSGNRRLALGPEPLRLVHAD